MKSTMAVTLPVSAMFCAAMLYCTDVHCQAQTANPAAAVVQPRKPHLKNKDNPELKGKTLTKPIDLLDLPAYSGKNTQFVRGILFPAVKGGASVTMQFSVKETPQEVLNWYKNAFASNQWQMLDNTAGRAGLAAMKANNVCHISTMGPSKKGSGCDFVLLFKFYQPTQFPTH